MVDASEQTTAAAGDIWKWKGGEGIRGRDICRGKGWGLQEERDGGERQEENRTEGVWVVQSDAQGTDSWLTDREVKCKGDSQAASTAP